MAQFGKPSTDGQLKAADVPPIRRLTSEIENQLCSLRENVMELNSVFVGVLKPEEAEKTTTENESPVMAPLEQWLYTQLMVIVSCIDRINNYKRRCQL